MLKYKRNLLTALTLLTAVVFIFTAFQRSDAMSNNEKNASLIQAVLVAQEVNQYLHTTDAAGRLPVVVQVANGDAMNGAQMNVGGKPVQFVEEAPKDGAVFVVDSMTRENGTTTIKFLYAIEGVRGSADVSGDAGSYKVNNISISEE